MPYRASEPNSWSVCAWRSRIGAAVAVAVVLLGVVPPVTAQDEASPSVSASAETAFRPEAARLESSVNTAETPSDVAGLLDLEQNIREVVEKVLPSVVGLIIGQGQGSGVIISPDGYILTAGHVSGQPGERVTVILPDGKQVKGVSLGRNPQLDNGLVRVTDESVLPLPFAPIGESTDLPLGSWTVALGHPGGFRNDRPPVVRVGRILVNRDDFLATDNTLVGGDSGGPLFDLDGRVIGIHSRIGGRIEANIHVPVDRFVGDWDVLASGQEVERDQSLQALGRHLSPNATDGLDFNLRERTEEGAAVTGVRPGSPGARAGLRVGDRVIAVDEEPVANGQEMTLRRLSLEPGEPVTYTVRRGEEELEVEVVPVSFGENMGRSDSTPRMGIGIDDRYSGVGVRVATVVEESPAMESGMQEGDVIVEIDGRFVRNWPELRSIFSALSPGDEITVVVRRDDRDRTLTMTLTSERELFRDE